MDRIAELVGVVDSVCDADPVALADCETLEALYRQLDRLEAAVCRASAAFDAGGEWQADGARSAAAWIATRRRMPMDTARRRVRLGRALRHLPAAEEAWVAGDVGAAHVSLLARARKPATEDALARDEAILVDQARELQFRNFSQTLAYWVQLADPDGAEGQAKLNHQRRTLHLSSSWEGQWFLDGVFDAIGGEILAQALKTIEDELFHTDWAEAKTRVGDKVSHAVLRRTPAQRRADALVAMARRSAAAPEGSRLPEPLFNVVVDYESFQRTCELARGGVTTPGSLVPWLDEAWVQRVVFDGPNRVKNIGVRKRLFTGATRASVLLRERECFHPYCDIPACDCQVDHIVPFAEGGLTVDDNGRPACGFHNRQRNRPPQPPP
jgi:Domain of unknown function (DUF222)